MLNPGLVPVDTHHDAIDSGTDAKHAHEIPRLNKLVLTRQRHGNRQRC